MMFLYITSSVAETLQQNTDITLNQAIQLTVERSPDLLRYGYEIHIQDSLLTQSKLPQIPTLGVEFENGFGSGEFSGLKRLETTISIGWLFNKSEVAQRVNIAQANYDYSYNESEIARIDAAAETAERYLICLANQNRKITAIDAFKLAESTILAVEKRVNASRAPKAELARAHAQLALRKLALDDIEHELENSYTRLAAQWGDFEPYFSNVSGDISSLPSLESYEVIREQIKQNPQFSRILSKERLAKSELKLAKTLSKPQWRIEGGIRRFEAEDDQALLLNLSVPLRFKNQNQGNVAAKYAQLEKLHSESTALEVRLNSDLFILYQELQHSIHRATTLESVVIPLIT